MTGTTTTEREQLLRLEERVGGAGATAKLLGLPRSTSYAGYKNGSRTIPAYIAASLRAHLLLSDRELSSLQVTDDNAKATA